MLVADDLRKNEASGRRVGPPLASRLAARLVASIISYLMQIPAQQHMLDHAETRDSALLAASSVNLPILRKEHADKKSALARPARRVYSVGITNLTNALCHQSTRTCSTGSTKAAHIDPRWR